MAETQVAVLIDYENVGLAPIRGLFDQLAEVGRITIRRAYGDWSKATGSRDQLLEYGIEPVHVFQSAASGKNAADMRLAVDAVDLLHQAPVDVFVIVSADSDFVPVVNRLRAGGKTVIGAGPRPTAPSTLVRSCDRYLFLDQLGREKPVAPKADGDAQELIVRAVRSTMDEQGVVSGSKLHETLQRLEPSFDYRSLGYPTFLRFLETSQEIRVTRPKGLGDVTVRLVDGASGEPVPPADWAKAVDDAWAKRAPAAGTSIAGPNAAADAAAVLQVQKLSASRFSTLQRLLDASSHLSSHWAREGNSVRRR